MQLQVVQQPLPELEVAALYGVRNFHTHFLEWTSTFLKGASELELVDTTVRCLLQGRSEDEVLAALEKRLNVATTHWDEIFK